MSAEPVPGYGPEPERHRPSDRRAAATVVERHVTVRGQRVFVREQGEGHPLLLINGLGGNVEMWGPTEVLLSSFARTIAFDAPGMGRSRLTHPLPMPEIARVIGALLEELGHGAVDVLGYSLGGAMAQQFARSCPDRVRRLALAGTSCGWGSAPPEGAPLALVMSPLRYFSPKVYRATSHVLDGGTRFKDPDLADAQAAARSSHPPSIAGYAQQFLQGVTWSSLHWLPTLTMPALVLSGERDRLVPPANGLLLASRLPRSRFHYLPGEGHLVLFDPESARRPAAAAGLPLVGAARGVRGVDVGRGQHLRTRRRHRVGAPRCARSRAVQDVSRAYRAWIDAPAVRAAARLLPGAERR